MTKISSEVEISDYFFGSNCLSDDVIEAFKWKKYLSRHKMPPKALERNITIDTGDWATAQFVSYVASILIQEIFNINVTLNKLSDVEKAGARLAAGNTDLNLENWDSMTVNWQNSLQEGTIMNIGSIGYYGQSGWHMPKYVLEDYPNLGLDFWRTYSYNNKDGDAIKSIFPKMNTHSYLVENSTSTADNPPPFYPEHCINNSYCIEFWDNHNYLEAQSIGLIKGLKLNVSTVPLNSTVLFNKINTYLDRRLPFIAYNFQPATHKFDKKLFRLPFPHEDGGCVDKFNQNTTNNTLGCDIPNENLFKAVSIAFINNYPNVAQMMRRFKISEDMLEVLVADVRADEGYQSGSEDFKDYKEKSCHWIRENIETWKWFIPEAPVPPPESCMERIEHSKSIWINFNDMLEVAPAHSIMVIMYFLTIGILVVVSSFFGIKKLLKTKFSVAPVNLIEPSSANYVYIITFIWRLWQILIIALENVHLPEELEHFIHSYSDYVDNHGNFEVGFRIVSFLLCSIWVIYMFIFSIVKLKISDIKSKAVLFLLKPAVFVLPFVGDIAYIILIEYLASFMNCRYDSETTPTYFLYHSCYEECGGGVQYFASTIYATILLFFMIILGIRFSYIWQHLEKDHDIVWQNWFCSVITILEVLIAMSKVMLKETKKSQLLVLISISLSYVILMRYYGKNKVVWFPGFACGIYVMATWSCLTILIGHVTDVTKYYWYLPVIFSGWLVILGCYIRAYWSYPDGIFNNDQAKLNLLMDLFETEEKIATLARDARKSMVPSIQPSVISSNKLQVARKDRFKNIVNNHKQRHMSMLQESCIRSDVRSLDNLNELHPQPDEKL